MTILEIDIVAPEAVSAAVDGDGLVVELSDGRSVRVPLSWYPRLLHASPEERQNLRIIGRGTGIHWPDVEEDVSVASIVRGTPSMESPASLKRWLEARERQK